MTHTQINAKYGDDVFYDMVFDEGSNDTWCGECVTKAIKDTREGRLSGDEGVYHHNVWGRWAETEPVQCGNCNKQNDAYENLGDDD